MYMLERCTCRRQEEISKLDQTNSKAKKQHTQGSHFSKEKQAASGGTRTHDTLHSRQSTLHVHVYTSLPHVLFMYIHVLHVV